MKNAAWRQSDTLSVPKIKRLPKQNKQPEDLSKLERGIHSAANTTNTPTA
jgi:hypothetical protein